MVFFKRSSLDIDTIFKQLLQKMLNLLVDYSYLQIFYLTKNNLKQHKDVKDHTLYSKDKS